MHQSLGGGLCAPLCDGDVDSAPFLLCARSLVESRLSLFLGGFLTAFVLSIMGQLSFSEGAIPIPMEEEEEEIGKEALSNDGNDAVAAKDPLAMPHPRSLPLPWKQPKPRILPCLHTFPPLRVYSGEWPHSQREPAIFATWRRSKLRRGT